MEALTASSYGIAFVAGLLSTLSPCVLPLLPILLGSAASEHRFGSLALVTGLMFSFVGIGISISVMGNLLGLEQESFRIVGGVLLIIFGLLLLSFTLQQYFSKILTSFGNSQSVLDKFSFSGLHGQFLLGLLLGMVWSPCIGPTLGVAITLASQQQALLQVGLVMILFSIGTAVPLLAIGLLSRQAIMRWRGRIQEAGAQMKRVFGVVLLLIGLSVLFGADKQLEGFLLGVMPVWLIDLTTSL
ncbi:MAG: cytochrome c biogenesis CcdA family protein [Mariprofundales bacterium]